MSLTKVTYSMIKGAPLNVLDFGADLTGVTDSTAAIQAAVNEGVKNSQIVYMPAGTYLVTDTISIPMYTQIQGEHSFQNSRSYGIEPKGTKIQFSPTSAKSLFQASGPKILGGLYRSSYLIAGLYIAGNSINASGNSIYGLDLDSVSYSSFRDLTISGFRTGIRVFFSINNRFENVHIANAFEQNVLYAASTSTTDVWDQCTFHYAPVGVRLSGTSLGIRFTECLFEGIENYGVNIDKDSFAHTFVNCYAEEVPSSNLASGAMFRVGHEGTALTISNALTVIGGYFGGRNALPSVGSFIDADFVSAMVVTGPVINRYANGIKTTSNTYPDCIAISGMQTASVTTNITDFTKINGIYPHALIGAVGAEQRIRTPVILADEIRPMANRIILGSTTGNLGFYGIDAQPKPTVTGSRGGNAALTNLLAQLAGLGLITDSTT